MIYYSIVYVSTNGATDEKFAIGLMLFDDCHVGHENKYKYRYSQEKLNTLKPILTVDWFNILCDYFKCLEYVKFSYDEIDILHHEHSHNIIQIGEPTRIDMSFEDFDKLFNKYILNGKEEIK